MSNRLKEKGTKKVSNPSTTDTLNSFMNFTLQNLRVLDNNDNVFEKRFDYVLSKLADNRTIDEDNIGDNGTFVSQHFVEIDGLLHKIKYLIEGYQLVPIKPNEDGTVPEADSNKFSFKKDDLEFDIMAPTLEEAVEELKKRIHTQIKVTKISAEFSKITVTDE